MTAFCPACAGASEVNDSRSTNGTVKRRRECKACGGRWTTYEVSEGVYRSMVKRHQTLVSNLRAALAAAESRTPMEPAE